MTKIINGYAQPDIITTKDGEEIFVFVETRQSKEENDFYIGRTLAWLAENKPNSRFILDIIK